MIVSGLPAQYGDGVFVWVLGGAAVLGGLRYIWKHGVKKVFRGAKWLVNLPEETESQVKHWADESPRLVGMEAALKEHRAATKVWMQGTDDRLDRIENAVNHRGPDGPTLSRESAEMAATLGTVAKQVGEIRDHLGIDGD